MKKAIVKFKVLIKEGRIKVPTLMRHHCDMNAFRDHNTLGDYANSDLFEQLLECFKRRAFPSGYIGLDNTADNASIDTSKFLAVVTIEVPQDFIWWGKR